MGSGNTRAMPGADTPKLVLESDATIVAPIPFPRVPGRWEITVSDSVAFALEDFSSLRYLIDPMRAGWNTMPDGGGVFFKGRAPSRLMLHPRKTFQSSHS